MSPLFLAGAIALAAGAAQEKTPAVTVAAEPLRKETGAGFRVHGTSPLPDGAIVSLQIVFDRPGGELLATHNAEIRRGAYSAEMPLFPRDVFPGTYLFQAQVAPPRQNEPVRQAIRGGNLTLESTTEARIGTPEEAARARQAYLDEVGAAFGEIRKIRDEVLAYPRPGDAGWKAAVGKWLRRADELTDSFGRRMENRVLAMGQLDAEGFLPLGRALRDVCAAPRSPAAARIGKWMDAHAFGYRHHLGATTDDLQNARDLLTSLERALAEGISPKASELLELDALLPEQAHGDVMEFAGLADTASAESSRRMKELMAFLHTWAGQGAK